MLRPRPTNGKARPATTPLWPVLALAWLGSFGTAVAWAGIFFITEEALDYSKQQNLALGAVLGLVYAFAALFAGPITKALASTRRVGRARPNGPAPTTLSPRAVLAMVMVAAALVALVPVIWRTEWSIWFFGLAYTPLTGLLWPSVEQYVSSGRRGHDLNKAAGAFNLAWASAILVAMWCMVPLLDNNPRWIIGALAALHLACLVLLRWFNPEPHAHGEAAHDHDPQQDALFRRLLRVARAALFLSYLLHASLMPIIPQLMGELGIAVAAKPALASVWMTTRLAAFASMQRWRAWHGRRAVIGIGLAIMIAGYVACLVAPSALVLGLALALFGVGVGMVYAAAIYYALEVGSSDVDAGAKHEAMIGFGYATGPALSLLFRALPGTPGQ